MKLSRLLVFFLLLTLWGNAATLPFSFTLDEDATTSAGVFTPEGTLVRTLWRKVDYTRGDHTYTWDGLTDEQAPAAPGSYAIRVLAHHLDYIWQGAIGNTSTAQFGPTVHRGFRPLRDLTISGNDAFYITGYVEGDYDFRHFLTTDIQRVNDHWCWYRKPDGTIVSQTGNIFTPEWIATDNDGTWVYFAAPDSTNPKTRENHSGPGFVVASDVATHQSVSFSNGAPIENGPSNFLPFANGIKVGSKKGVAGIAVEKTGDTLAISVQPESKIYFVHKRTGAPLGSVSIPSPGQLSFSNTGELWAISGTNLCKITNIATSPIVSTVVSDLQQPLDVASNGNLTLVVDAGSSQQVKAFDNTGIPLWTFGQPGGYSANGPDVARDKFLFLDREGHPGGNIALAADGSFWLSDVGNRRLLHYAADRTYIEEIMFQNVSYSTSVDANNPTRVFSDFLEFAIDYSKPLAQGWQLTKNWGANLPKRYFDFGCGVRQVTTLSNGRTYGAVARKDAPGEELVELTVQGTRLTHIPFTPNASDPGSYETLTPTGALRRGHIFGDNYSGSTATFEEKPLLGFDDQNNPLWGSYTTLASAPATNKDPLTRCCSLGDFRMPNTSSDILISFDPTKNDGWHLGGVRRGSSEWLWKASPSGPLDGLGTFEIGEGVNYPGNSVFTAGRNIVFGYHGEFWKNAQACQFMHFYDDGLFIGQFGESSLGHESFEGVIPGLAGNSAFAFLTEYGGKTYLWTNDESQHGPQRWLLDGTQTIREFTATGTLGQSEVLTVPLPANSFPTGVTAQSGDGCVSLTWNPVNGADTYNIYKAMSHGGIPVLVAGGVTTPKKTINGLTNGQTVWFTVTAVTNTGETPASTSVGVTPANRDCLVETAGRFDQPGAEPSIFDVDSAAALVGKPAWRNLDPLLGDLALRDIGSAGYKIFQWSSNALTDLINLPFGHKIDPQNGWHTDQFLDWRFRVSGLSGSNSGLYVEENGNRSARIDITPPDLSLTYLTVAMPARFRDSASYRIRLTSKGAATPSVGYDANDSPGINHLYQFRFRGPVTLTVTALSGPAIVQAIFLDTVPLIPKDAD